MKFGVVMGSISTLIGAILKCIVKQELWIRLKIIFFFNLKFAASETHRHISEIFKFRKNIVQSAFGPYH